MILGTGTFATAVTTDGGTAAAVPLDEDKRDHLSSMATRSLEDPSYGLAQAEELGDGLGSSPPSSLSAPLAAGLSTVHEIDPSVDLGPPSSLDVELAQARLLHGDAGQALLPADEAEGDLPPDVERALAWLVLGARTAETLRPAVADEIDDEGLALLAEDLQVDEVPEPGETARLLTDGEATNLAEHEAALASIDRTRLIAAHATMAEAVDRALAELADRRSGGAATAASADTGDVFETGTPYGRIVVSGGASHNYTEEAFVTIDLGGDDRYENNPGAVTADILGLTGVSAPPSPTGSSFPAWAEDTRDRVQASHNVSLSIDLSGNDTYAGASLTQGFGALGGFGALVDVLGDDTYTADILAQGSGVLAGAGFLLDRAGENEFTATRQAQGYAQDAGIGWLVSGTGTDTYDAEVLAQGTGFIGSLSAGLVDGTGQDRYRCTGVVDFGSYVLPVDARPGSTCQGSGFGGPGLLVDATGDDTYTTASSFRAMALLGTGIHVDGGGQDMMAAGEWANGMGALGVSVMLAEGVGDNEITSNMAEGPWTDVYIGSNGEGYLGLGILATGSGNDRVLGDVDKDVAAIYHKPQYACSSGCGFQGVGIAASAGGDDLYRTEVGQGAGVNGTGILVNEAGNDTYETLYDRNRTQGYAEGFLPGSECTLGLVRDGGGHDSYDNPATDFGDRGDGRAWGQGDYGRGLDGSDGTAEYAQDQALVDALDVVDRRGCERFATLP